MAFWWQKKNDKKIVHLSYTEDLQAVIILVRVIVISFGFRAFWNINDLGKRTFPRQTISHRDNPAIVSKDIVISCISRLDWYGWLGGYLLTITKKNQEPFAELYAKISGFKERHSSTISFLKAKTFENSTKTNSERFPLVQFGTEKRHWPTFQ